MRVGPKFQLQRPSNKKNFITLDFRDSRTTLTYAQESIFSLTNHSAIVCDSTSVTISSCNRQKMQTSQQRQRPTQYAHTGDFTMGYARRPSA